MEGTALSYRQIKPLRNRLLQNPFISWREWMLIRNNQEMIEFSSDVVIIDSFDTYRL